ncbi:tRNA (guanosine(46)-N7)-methyltransferase TrmB [Cellulomonas marina]|uniref:tRNA (guanine-N(7)-)-methyltransferase n=1 Tax=Cellulomonas marina TaxID=988821 RepID=A0A1I0ZH01_9CELL|nr:tRNA (guanosine(46)-N7)-methyltransferase TrmB [Cellulomonas marina]GIG28564.1 tRNA (guanine-N(7)-)-methyltransferase [Cellulomonas marina]SFB24801.1 tRNA (guanine-N7-)-methyltransferase [Cellulomonas marina]
MTTAPQDRFTHVAARPHEPLRTFHPRRAALGAERRDALDRLWPRWGFSVHDEALGPLPLRASRAPGSADDPAAPAPVQVLDAPALFGRAAPLVLEIGPGMGEATAAMAAADPGRDVLAVEAHLPGIAALLLRLEEAGLTNVRVGHGDALDLVRRRLPEGSLDEVRVFFPDPWPKPRHHKRRLVRPAHVALLRSRLVVGGTLHCATDWPEYAEAMLAALSADPGLANASTRADGFVVPRPAHRPETKFERRGRALGHEVRDLVFRRVA